LIVDLGEAQARGNIGPLDAAVTVDVGQTSVEVAAGGTSVAVSAVRLDDDVPNGVIEEPLLSERAIVVARSSFFLATGSGYAPKSPVQVWLNSKPALIATAIAAEDGSFRSIASLPNDVGFGQHTLRILVFAPNSTPGTSVSAGATAVKEAAFGVMLLDEAAFMAAQEGTVTLDDVNRSFLDAFSASKPIGNGQASGWIGLLMLLMLIVAYNGIAPLVASRRYVPRAMNAIVDDSLSIRVLGNRRYSLALATAGFVLSGLITNDFVPVFPSSLGFAVLMLLSAVDPLAGLVAGVTTLVGVVLGGGAAGTDDWRAAIVVASTYVVAPMFASAVARRIKQSSALPVAIAVGVTVFYAVGIVATQLVGALLRAELAVSRWVVLLLAPAATAFAIRWVRDQKFERQHRRELGLRRLTVTIGLIPAGLVVLSFIVFSNVLLDDESLLTLLLLGLIVGLRQARTTPRFPRSPSPSRSRRAHSTTNATRRPPASRSH